MNERNYRCGFAMVIVEMVVCSQWKLPNFIRSVSYAISSIEFLGTHAQTNGLIFDAAEDQMRG
jgi:hypothetical protein